MFPNAAHDDMADMMWQASAWLLQTDIPAVAIYNASPGGRSTSLLSYNAGQGFG